MPLPIQLGDVVERLRRLLDLRGRIPLAFDETVVPVVIVGNADAAPYQLDPVSWALHQRGTGAAGAQVTIGISNQGPEGSVAIVEQLAIATGAAGDLVEISRSGTLTVDVPADSNVAADLTSEARPGSTGRDVPVRADLHTATTITTVGSLCEIVASPTSPSLILPVRHYLRKGEVLFVKCLSNAKTLTLGASGRFWSQLSDTG